MFDIGFLEIMVILVITLLVIGPERMPEVARKIGSFMGKMRRFIHSVKSEGEVAETINDFKKSIDLEEQKKQMTDISDELNKGLSVGLENVNLDDLHRPFHQSNTEKNEHEDQTFAPSQFNKAPAQPNISAPENTPSAAQSEPRQADTTETSSANKPAPNTVANSDASETNAPKETTAKN